MLHFSVSRTALVHFLISLEECALLWIHGLCNMLLSSVLLLIKFMLYTLKCSGIVMKGNKWISSTHSHNSVKISWKAKLVMLIQYTEGWDKSGEFNDLYDILWIGFLCVYWYQEKMPYPAIQEMIRDSVFQRINF